MSHSATNSGQSQALATRLEEFVAPLLQDLDDQIDKRLVRTFLLTLQAIISFRHSRYGLLLSELGGYIVSPSQAPAGTKRLSNLLRSPKWNYWIISRFLWRQAHHHVEQLEAVGKRVLVIWDASVIEKAESLHLEGLCPVRSSQAQRLKRIKPGFYNPPGGRPIFVPGMQWMGLLVAGMEGIPRLAAMHWWTTRGKFASKSRNEATKFLHRCSRMWGQRVLHVWDRGYASSPWLGLAFRHNTRFVLRWKTKQKLVDGKGKRNAWKITRGKRSMEHRLIRDARRKCYRKTGIIFAPVTHPDYPEQPLFLVVSRPGKGKKPWYLLTNEPLQTVEDAWQIVFAYARRWQIEMTYRYAKTELAMESPRLWAWNNRLKLMMMVALVYAFLLSLVVSQFHALIAWLLRHWAHRTGKKCRDASIPVYRLRSALSRLWGSHPPTFQFRWENSG